MVAKGNMGNNIYETFVTIYICGEYVLQRFNMSGYIYKTFVIILIYKVKTCMRRDIF